MDEGIKLQASELADQITDECWGPEDLVDLVRETAAKVAGFYEVSVEEVELTDSERQDRLTTTRIWNSLCEQAKAIKIKS